MDIIKLKPYRGIQFKHAFRVERVQLNPIQDAIFCGGGGQKGSLPKICHTYPTMIKLGTIIAYPKKIQKLYESPKFC